MLNLASKSGAIKALSLNHSRQSAVEGPLSMERRSSEARFRRASLLVALYFCKGVREQLKYGDTDVHVVDTIVKLYTLCACAI